MEKRLTIICALLLALWLPASSYTRIACAGLVPSGDCCNQNEENSAPLIPDSCSICCVIDTGTFIVTQNSGHEINKLMINHGEPSILISIITPEVAAETTRTLAVPPLILPSLQFSLRMALPPLSPPQIA